MQSYLATITFGPQRLAHPSSIRALCYGFSHSYVYHLNDWYVVKSTLFIKSTSIVFLQQIQNHALHAHIYDAKLS